MFTENMTIEGKHILFSSHFPSSNPHLPLKSYAKSMCWIKDVVDMYAVRMRGGG